MVWSFSYSSTAKWKMIVICKGETPVPNWTKHRKLTEIAPWCTGMHMHVCYSYVHRQGPKWRHYSFSERKRCSHAGLLVVRVMFTLVKRDEVSILLITIRMSGKYHFGAAWQWGSCFHFCKQLTFHDAMTQFSSVQGGGTKRRCGPSSCCLLKVCSATVLCYKRCQPASWIFDSAVSYWHLHG